MRIQSTKAPSRSTQPPRGGYTAAARLDQDVSQGRIDSDSYASGGRYDPIFENKAAVIREATFEGIGFTSFGAFSGFALTDFTPLGAAIGAGLGAYIAWNRTLRSQSGNVKVRIDGKTQTTKFYKHPSSYQKVPGQLKAEMMADGRLGERIAPKSVSTDMLNSTKSVNIPKELKGGLIELSAERRLLADLGQKSRYGYEVLSPVTASTAAQLLESDTEIFAVSGKSSDQTHTLEVIARNQRRTSSGATSATYIERTFDYQLKQLKAADDLKDLPKGQGLPEGFSGTYKNLESCSLTVGMDRQEGHGIIENKSNSRAFSSKRSDRDQRLDLGPSNKAEINFKRSLNVRDLSTMGGVLAGLVAATTLAPGQPSIALMSAVAGGVAGRELGWLAQDKMPAIN